MVESGFEYGKDKSVELTAPGVDTYYAVVRSLAAGESDFEIQFSQPETTVITVGEEMTSESFYTIGDARFYQLATTTTDPLLVLVQGSTFSTAYDVEVRQGTVDGPSVGVLREYEYGQSVEVESPAPGLYYVMVQAAEVDADTFDISFVQRAPVALSSGVEVVARELLVSGDSRYYTISANAGETIVAMVTGSTYASGYSLEVRQGGLTGTLLGEVQEGANDLSVAIAAPSAGVYSVVVRSMTDGERTFDLNVATRSAQTVLSGIALKEQVLWGLGDVRYFHFSATTMDPMVVMLQGSTFASDYSLELHQGTIDGPIVGTASSSGNDLSIELQSPTPGEYYIVVSNLSDGERTFTLTVDQRVVEPIGLNTRIADQQLSAKGDGRYYEFSTAAASDGLTVQLLGSDLANGYEVRVTRGALDGEEVGTLRHAGNSVLVEILSPQVGKYFISVLNARAGSRTFSIQAEQVSATLTGVSPDHGGNAGRVTTMISGTYMQGATAARLVNAAGNQTAAANLNELENSRWFRATFDLQTLPAGQYDLVVTTANGTDVRLANGFQVEQGGEAKLWVNVSGPTSVRVGRTALLTISYGNTGNIDSEFVIFGLDGIPSDDRIRMIGPANSGVDTSDITMGYNDAALQDFNDSQLMVVDEEEPDVAIVPFVAPFVTANDTQSIVLEYTPVVGQEVEFESFVVTPKTNNSEFQFHLSQCLATIALDIGESGVTDLDPTCISGSMVKFIGWGYNAATGGEKWWSLANTLLQIVYECLVTYLGGANVKIAKRLLKWMKRYQKGMKAWGAFSNYGPGTHCWEALSIIATKVLRMIAVRSVDPNEIYGPAGSGDAHYVSGMEPLPYTITFENMETATASAQEVVVTDQLDAVTMNLDTFSLGPMTFGDQVITPPSGLKSYIEDVDLRPAMNLMVRVEAELNMDTAVVTWRFSSLDPDTMLFTDDALAGFLPPNVTAPDGEGSVMFTVEPIAALQTGATISNQASIVFDANAPIVTNVWTNTVDKDAPESSITTAPVISSTASFEVCWAGIDSGAGDLDYTVYVSGGGAYMAEWLTHTPDTCATWDGADGQAYQFHVVARDGAGNTEMRSDIPDATVSVQVVQNDTDSGTDSDTAGQVPIAQPKNGAESGCGCEVTGKVSSGAGGLLRLLLSLFF